MTLLSRKVDSTRQGQLQGMSAALHGAAGALGPLLFGAAYTISAGSSSFVTRGSGAMLLAALICAVAALAAHGSVVRQTRNQR